MSEPTYEVVYSDETKELAERVNSMMLDGWVPQGGICAVMIDAPTYENFGCYAYYQAMVRAQPKEATA